MAAGRPRLRQRGRRRPPKPCRWRYAHSAERYVRHRPLLPGQPGCIAHWPARQHHQPLRRLQGQRRRSGGRRNRRLESTCGPCRQRRAVQRQCGVPRRPLGRPERRDGPLRRLL
ncbi:hypothetical protein DMC25_27105 [Caulobacter sp. D4A]|nr:hypothetical protein DMC25_27105 [Caulobacter sp. D4A]